MAPLEVEYVLRIARLLDKAGLTREAIAHMRPVVDAQRAPAKLFVYMVELLDKVGDRDVAIALVHEAKARTPDHPAIVKLCERLPAF